MDGVNIISNLEHTGISRTMEVIILIAVVVAFVSLLAVFISIDVDSDIGFIMWLAVFIASIITTISVVAVSANKVLYKSYLCTISDDVKLTEFYEHYKVIEHDGDIYEIVKVEEDA